MRNLLLFIISAILMSSCQKQAKVSDQISTVTVIEQSAIEKVAAQLKARFGESEAERITRGTGQVARLWRESDGSAEDYEKFCLDNFVAGKEAVEALYLRLERNFEILNGYFHKIDVALKEPLQLEGPEPGPSDHIFGGYNAAAHLTDDLFANKIAFLTVLNFPFYTLKEKTNLGNDWTRKEWAYARMGDQFTSRVPAEVIQNASKTLTAADTYISGYNIHMGNLIGNEGEKLFPSGLKLITHWGLRDELKSNYKEENGIHKQRMIYQVMKRIIDQSIPAAVINNERLTWNPYGNKVMEEGKEVAQSPEPDTRYEVLLANFRALKAVDAYNSAYPDYLSRAFEEGMELPKADVERLFTEFVSSPLVRDVATLISQRLGRPLEPFDIWYVGFRSGGGTPEEKLNEITKKKYPDREAVMADLPIIMKKLGWSPEKAQKITSLITVDASRGAGHAWGATMRNDVAHLRTRIGADGMDYKGYNIAVHEFGHCVEQTITMNDVDHYLLNGVPNTAFTEAVAFLFQKRDLELLGISQQDPLKEHLLALDNFWSSYEIMGVSLLDIKVWEWLYQHPDATAAELKEAVISLAKEVWNKYYAGILGESDEPILAIYSHMIDNPLYLSNYPIGHLIDFQIEQQVAGKNLADEIGRMYTQGRVIPQLWMKNAVGQEISIEPTIMAAGIALEVLRNEL